MYESFSLNSFHMRSTPYIYWLPDLAAGPKKQQQQHITIYDFHDFGLISAGQMHCLPQRLKSTLFEIFSNGGCPKGTRGVEKISNNVDFNL